MKSIEPGYIVRVGTQVVTGFRYPDENKKLKFKPGENEKQIAQACIAILGDGPAYDWGQYSKSSAQNIADKIGGEVERAK